MRISTIAALTAVLLSQGAVAYAADLNVILSGQVAPGVYGRVDYGNGAPPPVVYERPIIVQRPVQYVAQPPLYLHVPPGHVRDWYKHCNRYNACGREVYFVRSGEYEEHGHGKGHGKDHDRN
jgi:hypothetical protein